MGFRLRIILLLIDSASYLSCAAFVVVSAMHLIFDLVLFVHSAGVRVCTNSLLSVITKDDWMI